MAPIATSSYQIPVVTAKKGTGDYKEQSTGQEAYDRNLEEEGEGKAHVIVVLSRGRTLS